VGGAIDQLFLGAGGTLYGDVFIEEPGITGGNTRRSRLERRKLIQAALDGEQAAACLTKRSI